MTGGGKPGVGMLEKEICLPGEKDNSMPGELNEVRITVSNNMTDKKLPHGFYDAQKSPAECYIK